MVKIRNCRANRALSGRMVDSLRLAFPKFWHHSKPLGIRKFRTRYGYTANMMRVLKWLAVGLAGLYTLFTATPLADL